MSSTDVKIYFQAKLKWKFVDLLMIFAMLVRLELRNPLLRLFGELQVFTERAIVDCAETAEAAEKARTEYRGSLLWMKKTSKEVKTALSKWPF